MTPQSLARPFTAVAVAVTLTVAACGGDDSSSGSSSTIRPAAVTTAVDASTAQPVGQSPAQTVDQPVVVIARSRFGTPELRVAVGTTVVFENTDEYAHTVSSAADSPIAFGSEELGQGDTFSITFDTPGVYSYYCMIHPTIARRSDRRVIAVRHLVLVDHEACSEPGPGQVVWSGQTSATMNNVVQLRRPHLGEPDARGSSDAAAASAIVRAGRGDESAFAEFYDAVSSVVHGTVLRVVRSPAMAEEVTQEVFLELWRQAPRFDAEKGSPRSWAATVAHRRAVDRVRSEQSARVRDDADARLTPRDQDGVVDQVTANAEQSEVVDALAQLTDAQREAVSLAYYGGHTYREVAVLLGVPEGTVKTRIRDGLIKLRDLMGVTA